MALWNLIKRVFGFGNVSVPAPKPVAATSVAARTPIPQRDPGIMVQREEIIDGRPGIAGYLFRIVGSGNRGELSAQEVVAALQEDQVQRFAQRRIAVIPLRFDDRHSADFRPLIGPLTTFLVSPSDQHVDLAAWRDLLGEIRGAGARVGIYHATAVAFPATMDWVDWVLDDFRTTAFDAFERRAKQFVAGYPGIGLAVAGIGAWSEHHVCQALGVRFSFGDFAATLDDEVPREALSQSRMILLEMLNLLRREADSEELAAVAKRDPGIVAKIMDMANSPLSGLEAPAAGLDQALMVLGREMLYRWISVGIYRAGGGKRDEMLLEIALCRARFLELIAQGILPKRQCDELFLVGMFSVFDSLLGMPLENVTEKILLPRNVIEVLLRNEGPYSNYMSLVIATERGWSEQAERLAEKLGITLVQLGECNVAALAWAEEALQAS